MSAQTYEEFVAAKVDLEKAFGFHVPVEAVHPLLLPHQRDIVCWAVAGGRRALFERFGLGKTIQQLEILRLILEYAPNLTHGRALIVLPLGVRGEFRRDAAKLGLEVTFVQSDAEVAGPGIYLTNYNAVRDGKLSADQFDAVSLDEASVLRSFGSKTYQEFLPLFAGVPYRFVATATPSPNRHKELIHYAAYLGILDSGQSLTRWFQRNSEKAGDLTLLPHRAEEFWLWLNTWAVFVQSPADLGYNATGYDLPDLNVTWHEVAGELAADTVDRDGQSHLFKSQALGLSGGAREKRETMPARLAELARILEAYDPAPPVDGRLPDQLVIWCDLNAEQDAIERMLAQKDLTFSSIHGGLSTDEAERRMDEWRDRRTYALVGKPVMLGQGVNLQQSNKAVFVGVTYKFEQTIQAVHRIQRYGQTRACEVHIIHADTETDVVATLQRKWIEHEELTDTMSAILREHGLSKESIAAALRRSIGVERIEASGQGWLIANNDCIPETRSMESNSVDLIVTSVPFGNHYQYSEAAEDLGFTDNNDHFWAQMDYLTPELLRVLAPGRIYACHVKDRILFGAVTGAGVPTVSPFHAEAIFHGQKHGFDYLGMITVVTDVVRENNQTYRLGWSEMAKDGTKMGVGSPEYILLFHKPQTDRSKGYADEPVTKDKADYTRARWQVDAHAFWRSGGDRLLTPDELAALPVDQRSRVFTEQTLRQVYDYESHIRIGEDLEGRGALPATFMSLAPGSWHPDVWHDIARMLTLNGEQAKRAQEQHICPLQFQIVDRLIGRYSNPGELVYDPFGGLGTVPVRALRLGRRGRTVELNGGYFLDAVKYLEAEERRHDMPSLFDLAELEVAG